MMPDQPPSFSPGRRWSISFNVLISTLTLLAVVLMANYLAARHFWRVPLSTQAQTELSTLTHKVLQGVTNQVKVTAYFEKASPLFDSVWALLKEYQFACPKLNIRAVDCELDPAAAEVAARYKLPAGSKNLIIFECQDRTRMVTEGELSELDMRPLMSGQSQEVKRTHFKGEQMFTSAIYSVITPRQLKAYFAQGHGEHRLDSDEGLMGYSRFAELLKDNNIQVELLKLAGPGDIPDCQLLIIAGPTDTFVPEELSKIDRYLKQGGRLLVFFNYLSVEKELGLEKLLANWGIEVGRNVVLDQKNSFTGKDLVVATFGNHPMVKPLIQSRGLYLLLPRSISKANTGASSADAPQVEPLVMTTENGRVVTQVKKGELYATASDKTGNIPLMVAVEKGALRGVTDRGATRIVAVGDSIFMGNETIDKVGNYEFANLAMNWLLARNELIGALGPRPIREYKLTMTRAEMMNLRWGLLAGMPGGVLLLGTIVWFRRRH